MNFSLRNLLSFVLVIAAAVAIYKSLNSYKYNRERVQYIINNTQDTDIKNVLFIVWMNDLSTTRYRGRMDLITGEFQLLSADSTFQRNGKEHTEIYLRDDMPLHTTDPQTLAMINHNAAILARDVKQYLHERSINGMINAVNPSIPAGYESQINVLK